MAAEERRVNWEGDVEAARAAVTEAKAAVATTSRSLDLISHLLKRHYRTLMFALGCAALVSILLVYLVSEIKEVTASTNRQAVANEVEVIRHRANEREGHHRLCIAALGASRPEDLTATLCRPVLGDDYTALKKKLSFEEKRLKELQDK